MELKTYQKKVIADLTRYLDLLNETGNYIIAFQRLWEEQAAPALGRYQDVIPGTPNICFKIPTGGGKTFVGCNSIRPIFDALPATKAKTVVWLVPSDAILAQTTKALKDTSHPYRQKIDVDFGGRVEVYTKQELLNGQNFNPTSITEQLSIMVLSYDSFRGRGKEGLKAYQENSNLAEFVRVLGKPDNPIQKADETALFQIINQLNPLVIVDESHHARSDLSLEMLANFNPCFVLDMTATPKKESNIISYVDAVQLKSENMVKLPVVVYNRNDQKEVISDAIDLRNRLEEFAITEQKTTGHYIRPIVLFQAEPKGKEDAATFKRIQETLITYGIPADQIAIKTSDINELRSTDLMSVDCPVRYIITVNALKEGWDCPFAYILASLANKTSQIDVEQIVGRILRLPYTTPHKQKALNQSYVLTSSADFNTTIQHIIKGLNNAGFSKRDYRLSDPVLLNSHHQPFGQLNLNDQLLSTDITEAKSTDDTHADLAYVSNESGDHAPDAAPQKVDIMIKEAERAAQTYDEAIHQADNDPYVEKMAWEVREKVTTYSVKPIFRDDIANLAIPQFFRSIPDTLFTESRYVKLDNNQLAENFVLRDKDSSIDFALTNDEIRTIDVSRDDQGAPKAFNMNSTEQHYFKEYFNNLPEDSRVRICKDMIFRQLNRNNGVSASELKIYVDRIVGNMDKDQLAMMEKAASAYARKIREKVDSLLQEHCKQTFYEWLQTDSITCKPSFHLPANIHPTTKTDIYGKSLYEAEDGNINNLEGDLIAKLTALQNVRWWHRNIVHHGFCINGFINHYPDIIIKTEKGKIICAETKGEYLKNEDTKDKINLGNAWSARAGSQFRYFMVFREDTDLPQDAVSMSRFLEIVKEL